MKERIEAVQKGFWWLLAGAVVVVLIGLPTRDDGATTEALEELRAFQAGFDREQLYSTLRAHATAHGVLPLSRVTPAVEGPGTPEVRAASDAKPLEPRVQLSLGTLAEIHALSGSTAQATIASVEPQSLARGLGWRLARKPAETGYVLSHVELLDRMSSEADLELEEQVVEARQALAARRAELKRAETAHEKAEALHEARRKWKAPWKAIVRANEKRRETKAELAQAQAALSSAHERYQELADEAAGFKGRNGVSPQRGTARAVLRAGDEDVELIVPVALQARPVQIPGLTGAGFPVLHARGLWDELKASSVSEAIARLEARFSWHAAGVEIGPITLGGTTLLQLAPVALIFLLLSLRRRSQGVGDSYNPFGLTLGESLPRVGLGVMPLNALVLIVLPLAGSLLCAWSLLQLDHFPVLPVLCAAGSIVLGALCHVALKELGELRDNVTRSHSHPPPAPATGESKGS